MRPEPLSGVGRLLRFLRARGMCMPVLMLGIRPDCLRSEPRL